MLGELGHHRFRAHLWHVDAFDREQEFAGFGQQLHRIRRKAERQNQACLDTAFICAVLAIERLPQHARGKAGGLLGDDARHFVGVFLVRHEQRGVEFGIEPGLDDIRTGFDQVCAHRQKARVILIDVDAGGDAAREAFFHQARRRRLPDDRRVNLAGAEVAGHHLDVLVQVILRRHALLLEHGLGKTVRTGALGGGDLLAIEPLHRRLWRGEGRRILAHQKDVAHVLAHADGGHQADVRDFGLGGRDDGRHVAHVADVLLAGQHVVDDDRALQADLKLDGRTLGQIFFVELLAAHHHAGPGLGVVRLIADHQLDRLAGLAVVDVSCHCRRGCKTARHGQRRCNPD